MNLSGDSSGTLFSQSIDDDSNTLLSQHLCHRFAEAGSRPGDQRYVFPLVSKSIKLSHSRHVYEQTSRSASRRPRNSAETKRAILLSARAAFSQYGYDGVGVREIARVAGVTGILVNRYFGSKEQLFSDVIASTMENPGILSSENLSGEMEIPEMARRLATALLMKTMPGSEQLDGFLILLRSASNERAAAIWRKTSKSTTKDHLRLGLRGSESRNE